MVAQDQEEVTVIVEESAMRELRAVGADRGYRMLETRVAAGFASVGLLAAVTRALAEAGLSILVVSTYSKDCVLLKEASLAAGLQALSDIGFRIVGT
jgi:hypothetical protein